MNPEEFQVLAKNQTMRNLNPDLFKPSSHRTPVRPEPIPIHKGSTLEEKFYDLWECLGGPKLEREHKFLEDRRYRLDFYHVPSRTGIEVDGGTWVKSGHSTGTGLIRDKEKSNECTFSGIQLFRLTPEMITVENLKRIISFIAQKADAH